MYLKKYLTFKTNWQKHSIDEDTLLMMYEEPIVINCFKYGKNIYIRESEENTLINAQVYLVIDEVQIGDKIDGQVVKSVNMYPETWHPERPLYEVLTWNE